MIIVMVENPKRHLNLIIDITTRNIALLAGSRDRLMAKPGRESADCSLERAETGAIVPRYWGRLGRC